MTVEVKVCGLRRPEDARLAARLGAGWIGVVRAPDSPRSASLDEARRVIAAAREENPRVRPVLATGRRSADEVGADARALDVERVQPHGIGAAGARRLSEEGLIVHRVVTIGDEATELPDFDPPRDGAPPIVFDVGGGGTGRSFDWNILGGRAPDRVFIAGGLRPENVERLLPRKPWGVDVSSGIEAAPGVKDPDRLRAFFDALRPGR